MKKNDLKHNKGKVENKFENTRNNQRGGAVSTLKSRPDQAADL